MIIRSQQMAGLERSAQGAFENRLLSHIQEFFPVHWRETGAERLRAVIRTGITNAATYGLAAEREIYLFVSLMLYLGSSFDTDFQLPWAADALKEASEEDPFTRIDRTYHAALDYLHRVAGPDGIHTRSAIERYIVCVPRVNSKPLEKLPEMLMEIHPQKYRELSPAQVAQLGEQGRRWGFFSPEVIGQGKLLCGSLALLLGHGFAEDPQFYWAKEALSVPGSDPAERLAALQRNSVERLKKWICQKGPAQ